MTLEGLIKALHQVNKIRYRPALVYNIARAYFRTLVLRKPTLRICEFSITDECQSNCAFCYAAKFHRPDEAMLSVDEIARTWEQARALGAFSSVVFGGEPLLHPEFFQIIERLEPKKHIVTFTTNGIALTDEVVREFKRLGGFLINVSINSLDPAINDELRGYEGHLDKAMAAVQLCKKHGVDVFLPVATAKSHLQETIRIVEFAKKEKVGVTINLMCAMGRSEGQQEELFDEAFWEELRELYNKNPGLRSDYDVNLDLKIGCPAGYEKIHVSPYGDVTGCSMNPAGFGNVRNEPLAAIVERMRSFHHFAKGYERCLVAVDPEYIRDYMDYAADHESTLDDVASNPSYEQHRDRTPR